MKRFLPVLMLTFVVACSNKDAVTIAKNKMGVITSKTKIHELKGLFANDSVVKNVDEGLLGINGNYYTSLKYQVFAKGGKLLLEVLPVSPGDTLSLIRYVDIFDPKFITEESEIGLNNTFKEINEKLKVNKVEPSFTKVTLFIDEINATMTIDKKDLGIESYGREDVTLKQIPDDVKPKSFVVWFDK